MLARFGLDIRKALYVLACSGRPICCFSHTAGLNAGDKSNEGLHRRATAATRTAGLLFPTHDDGVCFAPVANELQTLPRGSSAQTRASMEIGVTLWDMPVPVNIDR